MNEVSSRKMPRGLRNNNPLNIRRSKAKWVGLSEKITDTSFCQFQEMKYGWRAAFYLLTRTYYHKYRCYSIKSIISRWAPDNENNTEAYIKIVSQYMNYEPERSLDLPDSNPALWMKLGVAMAIVENGTDSLDYFAMLDGWEMARSDAHSSGSKLEM